MVTELDLAIEQHKRGNTQAALAVYERLASAHPESSRLLRYRGLALYQTGQYEAGLQCLRRATALAPADAPAWSDLGRMYALQEKAEQAIECFRKAVAADAGYADAWHNLGVALRRHGDTQAALEAYRRALAINPKRGDSYLGIGNLLVDDNQHENAIESFRRAAACDPNLGQARASLAGELSGRGDVSEAEFIYRQALALDPQHAQAWYGLGRTLEDLGRADEAAYCYRKVLERNPAQPYALGQLLSLPGIEPDEPLFNAARAALQHKSTPDAAKALIGYGLGKALDRRGEYDRAFAAFRVANQSRRAQAGPFDRAEFDQRIERIIETFTPQFFAGRSRYGVGTDQPVFILGMPRSGTTLTEQILHSHPQMAGAGELPFIAELAASLQDRFGLESTWPRCAAELSKITSRELAHDYLEKLRARTPQAALRVSDKSPLNFFHLGLIALLFPAARIVHCRRDPVDTCLSIYFENFRPNQTHATDLDDLAHYYRGYQRLMAHWRAVLPLAMHELHYENAVAETETQARSLVDFMGLEWDARCLDFHRNPRAVQTPSRWQVRQPVYASSVGRWRHYQRHLESLKRAFPESF